MKRINKQSAFNNRILWTVLLMALIVIISTPSIYAHEEDVQPLPNTMETQPPVQTTCPVLVGNPINRNIYTDYKGKRVYFYCTSCKADFEKNPEKYLENLPQFASALESDHNHDHALHEHGSQSLMLARLIVPMGIITLSLVAVTVALSIFRRMNIRFMMKWHKRIGIAALISGAIHAILVLTAH